MNQGPDINLKDSQGDTPLMVCSRFQTDPEIFQLLMQHGANPLDMSKDGETAFDILLSSRQLRPFLHDDATEFSKIYFTMQHAFPLGLDLRSSEFFSSLFNVFSKFQDRQTLVNKIQNKAFKILWYSVQCNNILEVNEVLTAQAPLYARIGQQAINQTTLPDKKNLLHVALENLSTSLLEAPSRKYSFQGRGIAYLLDYPLDLNQADVDGNTPLHTYLQKNIEIGLDLKLIALLLAKGARIQQCNRFNINPWQTLLHSCHYQDLKVINEQYALHQSPAFFINAQDFSLRSTEGLNKTFYRRLEPKNAETLQRIVAAIEIFIENGAQVDEIAKVYATKKQHIEKKISSTSSRFGMSYK